MAASRPFGVTIVAIIAWITGALQIIAGIIAMFSETFTVGVITIIIGVITIAVSLGLFRGSNGSRIVVTIVFLLNIALSWYAVLVMQAGFWTGLGSILLPVIGLILLYTSRANAFFRS